ncbi:MAG: N-6 DNA methylase, partial [Bacteroidaceae bacterium]|nr:N-6 DNA methylase [Bacteroidaceae bacterium]
LIMLTGWDGECDLIDPFCGSGTILIEAALIAQNVYPGVFRKEYAFEKWKDFDAELFDRIYNDDSQEREFDHKIYGYDINRQAVQIATDNVLNAGVKDIVSVEQRDFYEFEKPLDKAIIITNPPYGDRITTDDIFDLYETIGKNLKRNFAGNDAWIISHHEELFDKIGFRPSTKYALFNGSLECEFRKYQIFDGKLRERREEGLDIKSDEERRHNLKFKPHKKNEDGEWASERKTENESHYFKSKPFKERPQKDKPFEEEVSRRWGKDSRWMEFEAEDEEEAEIINRHLGKWGDRRIYANSGSRTERTSRSEERHTDRDSRQAARKAFFSGKGDANERKAFGEGRKGEKDERRPRRDDERPARKFDGQRDGDRPFRGKKDEKK